MMDTVDTWTPDKTDKALAHIRRHMPRVYAEIRARAAKHGRIAYAEVRRGLAGEAGKFYAAEKGWVIGTPGTPTQMAALSVEVVAGRLMLGRSIFFVLWSESPQIELVPMSSHGSSWVGPCTGNSNPDRALVGGAGMSEREVV